MHERPIRGIFAGTYTGSGHHPTHRHPYWEIIYQRTGLVATRQGSTVFHMHPGMVLVHPPLVMHEDDAEGEYSLYYVQIEAPLDIPWPRVFSDDTEQSVGKICDTLAREWLWRFEGRERMIALLTDQLDLLLRRAKGAEHRSPEEVLVASAQRILEERYNLPMTAGELARRLGVSRSSLYSQFAAVTGMTPKDYVLRLRLERVLAMLRHTEATLETIAANTGFYSSSHLARHVKAATSQSPGAIRKAAQRDLAGLPTSWPDELRTPVGAHLA
jgi:AraC-like DNA-binding protein